MLNIAGPYVATGMYCIFLSNGGPTNPPPCAPCVCHPRIQYEFAKMGHLPISFPDERTNDRGIDHPLQLSKKNCPRLRDSACWRSGEITQPWTNFFVQLCTSNLFSALRLRSFLAPMPPSPNEKEREPATTFWLAMKGNLIWQHKAGFCSLTAVKELVLRTLF